MVVNRATRSLPLILAIWMRFLSRIGTRYAYFNAPPVRADFSFPARQLSFDRIDHGFSVGLST